MTPEERAKRLFKRIVSPITGDFATSHPMPSDIAAAIREAQQEAYEDAAKIVREARLTGYCEDSGDMREDLAAQIIARSPQETER